jgi:hypothetical protein
MPNSVARPAVEPAGHERANQPEVAGRPCVPEIEITTEMIAAGVNEFLDYDSDYERPVDAAVNIYEAMERARLAGRALSALLPDRAECAETAGKCLATSNTSRPYRKPVASSCRGPCATAFEIICDRPGTGKSWPGGSPRPNTLMQTG